MGATPRFCDVELASFNIDAGAIGALVGERTVGIVPVHLFGLCADMAPLATSLIRAIRSVSTVIPAGPLAPPGMPCHAWCSTTSAGRR